MQTGVITQDNLADVLRGISQRRRQGVLDIAAGCGTYKIYFVQGRIVDIAVPDMTPVQDLVTWLTRGGYPCQPWEMYSEHTYAELNVRLQDEFGSAVPLEPEVLRLAVRHRILERLYHLELGPGALYNFRVQMVSPENHLSPSISVGQLLLDIVEMEGEAESFRTQFSAHSIVGPTGSIADLNLPEEEERILKVIHDGCSVEELEVRSLLSSHAFRHGLLELRAHNMIAVRGTAPESEAAPGGEIGEYLDSSIDAAFAVDLSDDFDLDVQGPEAPVKPAVNVSSRAAANPMLQEEAMELAEIEVGVPVRPTWRSIVAPLSAQLLQSTLVPGLIATAFLVMALIFPLISWTPILSFFADH